MNEVGQFHGAAPHPECVGGRCKISLTPEQLLSAADRLVSSRRFNEARPFLEALSQVPRLTMERNFLEGYIAAETGHLDVAAAKFRAVLAVRPDMTRARLELARVLMLQGKDRAADYHFRLAEDDGGLTDDVRRALYAARSSIRSRERWNLSLGFGLAPDTNINSATNDKTVNISFGDITLPLKLDPQARRSTGIGQTLSVAAQGRVPLSKKIALVGRLDGYGVNYSGAYADDMAVLLAAGPEMSPTDRVRLRLEGLVARRWYGRHLATRQTGLRLGGDKVPPHGGSIGAEIEARRTRSPINDGLDGWTYSARLSQEHVVSRSLFVGVTAFARRDALAASYFSNKEAGVMAGIGGELPHGFNAGLSTQLSYAWYDEPLRALVPEPRRDWRLSTRLYAASRRLRIGDFAPPISYSFTRNISNLGLYDFKRHRIEAQFTRIF